MLEALELLLLVEVPAEVVQEQQDQTPNKLVEATLQLEVLVETVQIYTHHFSLSFPHLCLVTGKRLQAADTLEVAEVAAAGQVAHLQRVV